MESDTTTISPLLPEPSPKRSPLSSSLSALPKKGLQGDQFESGIKHEEDGTELTDPLKKAIPNEANWGSICKQLKKLPDRPDQESDPQRLSKRRASCADITIHPKDPDSPLGCSKQKRHRRTAAEIERGFKCTVSNCHKAYGTEGALKMHLRIKHPSHNNGSSNPRSFNPSILPPHNPIFPVEPQFDTMKIEHPTAVPYPSASRISPPSLSLKPDPSDVPGPLSPLVPSISPGTPLTPSFHPHLARDPHAQGPHAQVPQTHGPHAQVPQTQQTPGVAQVPQAPVPNWGSLMGFSEHIKFSNIPVLIIRIGNWKKGTNFYGDMVAKFLYEERKFVWEVYAVTTPAATFFVRIELRFDDITGIAFETNQEVAVLTLDFCNPPTFYQAEIVQHQPVVWNPLAIDVSEGDIFTLRRHVLQFQKDSVIHPLNHLLKVDPRLQSIYSSFDSNMYQGQHTPHSLPPTPVVVPSTPFSTPATPATPVAPRGPVFSHDHVSAHAPSFAAYEQAFAASQVPSHLNTSLNMNLPTPAQKSAVFYADTPLSEGEGDEDEEEDMDQDEEEEKEEQKGGEKGRPPVIPPNPTPHSFHTYAAQHGDLRAHHDPTAFLAHNYYTQSLNTIPMLELDPKDEKANDRQNRFMHPSPRYSVVVPGGAQQCACGGNYAMCMCFKGMAQCSAACMCARSAYESLTDGTASVPSSTPGIGNFPVDLSF